MSFDIYFVGRPADGDWDAAMDAVEAAADSDGTLTDARVAVWGQIKAAVTERVPGLHETVEPDSRELDDEATGLQITMFSSELSLSIPYWSDGDGAEQIVSLLRDVTSRVEAVTGLVGYDPQSGGAFLTGQPRQAVDSFDQVRVVLDEHAASSAESPLRKRRWWPFSS